MKLTLKIAAAIVLTIIFISAVNWLLLDAVVQRALEKKSSSGLGVAVEVEHVDLAVLDNELTVAGMHVQNPEGYAGRLFQLTGVRMAIEPATLLEDEVIVESLAIDSPSLSIEHSLQGTNLAKIFNWIEGAATQESAVRKQKIYRIRQLEINGGKVSISSSVAAKPPVVVTLPDIHMENVSNGDGAGLTLAQVYEKVFIKMAATAFRTGRAEIPAEMLLDVSLDLSRFSPELSIGMPEKAKGIVEKAQGILRDLLQGGEQESSQRGADS